MKETNTTAPLIDFQIEDLWPILWKQRSVIVLFLGTVLTATLVFGLLRTKEYRATALIHLTPRPGQEVSVNEVVDMNTRGYFEIQQFYRTQIQIIMSRKIREDVVREYNARGYDDLLLAEGGADRLYSMLTVVPEEQSQLVEISVVHTDPERAALLANLMAQTYGDNNLDVRRQASEGATEWLEQQIVEHEARVAETRAKLHAYRSDSDLVDLEGNLNTLAAQLTSLNEAYGSKSTQHVLLQTTLAAHEALLKRKRYDELSKVLESPLLEAATRDLAKASAEQANLATRYGPLHPTFVQSKARMEALEEAIELEVRRMIDAERARVTVAAEEVASLDAAIHSLKEQMLEYQRRAGEYDGLILELKRTESFYERLSARLEEVRLTARTQFNNVQVVDAALVPSTPYKPNLPMSLIVGAIVGAVGGVGLALFREYLDDTIASQLDVAAHLRVPFLGLIPRVPEGISSHEADLFTHLHPRSSVAEAVRGLRAMLEMNPNGPAPRRILVTSSVAREGKTSTALRLAVSFAQMGRRVVIVDADLRRPRVHKVFGHNNDVGLSSYLVGAATVDDIVNITEVPNFFAIYSGTATDHPSELMSSPRMEELLTALEERFDVILVDTPPSVALSDAVTLSRRVDGILLVVKEQAVSRAVVKQTIDQFRQVEANILGVVLNNVDLQRSGSKYKYYYAYRDYYANYGPEEEGGEKAAK